MAAAGNSGTVGLQCTTKPADKTTKSDEATLRTAPKKTILMIVEHF